MSKVANGDNFTSLDEKINSVHSGSYGRLCWDEPAATITTRFDTPAGGRFTHPEENIKNGIDDCNNMNLQAVDLRTLKKTERCHREK